MEVTFMNLVTSLYEGTEPIQLLPVLNHHGTNNITDWKHAKHSLDIIDHWDVPNTII